MGKISISDSDGRSLEFKSVEEHNKFDEELTDLYMKYYERGNRVDFSWDGGTMNKLYNRWKELKKRKVVE